MQSVLRAFTEESTRDRENLAGRSIAMKTNLIRMFTAVVVGLIAVCGSVTPVAAQSAFRGKFTLPQEVNWQGAKLPAGEYTFSLNSTSLPSQIIVRGPHGSAIILTSATNKGEVSQEASNLTIERRMGVSYIRDMYLAPLGVEFHYAVPQGSKNERELAQGPTSTEQVLVAIVTK
jgi:hypothetical protein